MLLSSNSCATLSASTEASRTASLVETYCRNKVGSISTECSPSRIASARATVSNVRSSLGRAAIWSRSASVVAMAEATVEVICSGV